MKRALMIAAAGIVVFGAIGALSHTSQQALISEPVVSASIEISVGPDTTASSSPEALVATPTPSPTAKVAHTATPFPTSTLPNSNYYQNVDGQAVHAPAYSNEKPPDASAKCRDGSYSFSTHRSGTCSGHGGVTTWY